MAHQIRNLLPPQPISAEGFNVWLTGVSMSLRFVTLGVVVEAPADSTADLGEMVPIGPSIAILTTSGELAVPLSAGSEGGGGSARRNGIIITRLAEWEPAPGQFVLRITSDHLGLDFSAAFSVEPL